MNKTVDSLFFIYFFFVDTKRHSDSVHRDMPTCAKDRAAQFTDLDLDLRKGHVNKEHIDGNENS